MTEKDKTPKPQKRSLFEEISHGLTALKLEREGKINLVRFTATQKPKKKNIIEGAMIK